MKTDKVEYNLGDIVAFKLDPDMLGMVTAIVFIPDYITYSITCLIIVKKVATILWNYS